MRIATAISRCFANSRCESTIFRDNRVMTATEKNPGVVENTKRLLLELASAPPTDGTASACSSSNGFTLRWLSFAFGSHSSRCLATVCVVDLWLSVPARKGACTLSLFRTVSGRHRRKLAGLDGAFRRFPIGVRKVGRICCQRPVPGSRKRRT